MSLRSLDARTGPRVVKDVYVLGLNGPEATSFKHDHPHNHRSNTQLDGIQHQLLLLQSQNAELQAQNKHIMWLSYHCLYFKEMFDVFNLGASLHHY